MKMNQKLFDKFCTLERELYEEKGPFKLFALIELEEVPGQWDVVMSSTELPDRDMETLKFVVNKIYTIVSKKEIVSRVILLDVSLCESQWVQGNLVLQKITLELECDIVKLIFLNQISPFV